ncbi:MAG: hypothetical protein ACPHK8_02425 [Thermoplasmatota archaeon]
MIGARYRLCPACGEFEHLSGPMGDIGMTYRCMDCGWEGIPLEGETEEDMRKISSELHEGDD